MLKGGKLEGLKLGDRRGKVVLVEVAKGGKKCLGLRATSFIRKGERIADIGDGFAVRWFGNKGLEYRSRQMRLRCLKAATAANGYDIDKFPRFKTYLFREHEVPNVSCVYVMCASLFVLGNAANCRGGLDEAVNVYFRWVGETDGYFALCASNDIQPGEDVELDSYNKSAFSYDQERFAFWSKNK